MLSRLEVIQAHGSVGWRFDSIPLIAALERARPGICRFHHNGFSCC
jgi:hypothetical protein